MRAVAAEVMSMSIRFKRPNKVAEDGPFSRSKLYELGAQHPGLFRKLDGITVIDTVMLEKILEASPPLTLQLPPRIRARQAQG
jgi:hypothetical protein